jgi:HPt (histidine-containing phosphotransfer) domain-containing protein
MPDLTSTAHPSRDDDIRRRLIELSGPEPHVDDFALFSDILRTFLSESPHLVASLADAIAGERAGDVEKTAHLLKGAAGNVGATRLASLLQTIEDESRTHGRPGRDEDLAAVHTELAAFSRAVELVAGDLDQLSSPTAPTHTTLSSSWSHA